MTLVSVAVGGLTTCIPPRMLEMSSGWGCRKTSSSFFNNSNKIWPFLLYKPIPYKAQIPLRRLCDKVADTNHKSPRHKSWHWLSWFVSQTFEICDHDKVHRLCRQTSPMHCNGLNSIRTTQTSLSWTLLQTSRHVEMVCVHNFRDLCWRISPKLHHFMICHRLCPQLSWFASTTFPAGKFRWKSV